jgi:hypothetical protein
MKKPSVKRPIRKELSSTRPADEPQFARFLRAADQLGEHLHTIFSSNFAKFATNASTTIASTTEKKSSKKRRQY